MKKPLKFLSPFRILFGLLISVLLLPSLTKAQALPTGLTATPIYDTTKAGLSFRKDRLPIVGMWEVPGKPQHFVVVGYFGYIWTLYPDTTQADTMAAWGPIKRYTRTQVADFNTWVMKGWEFGALGGAFDPHFKSNRRFYVIYNKYPATTQYRAGTPGTNTNNDGPGNPDAIVVVDRYIMSADYRTVVRDTEIIRLFHGTGYGSANMIFGSDGMLYITADAYNKDSWDSTIVGRKILRIDVSKQDPGLMYSIPTDNPFYTAANPAVRKEIYAFGFRNSYSLSYNYLTGQLYAAETGQGRWEEINHILPGRNYGWNNGADGASFGSNSSGIEGPCHIGNALDSTSAGGGFSVNSYTTPRTNGVASGNSVGSGSAFQNPYSRTINGMFYQKTAGVTPARLDTTHSYDGVYNCSNFQNAAWWTAHSTAGSDGLSNSAGTTATANVGNISPVFRGDPASPFYGYMFISDIAGVTGGSGNNFFAAKEDRVAPVRVGNLPTNYTFTGDHTHNGITTWAEDSYGNLYPIILSSRAGGPEQWHDIWMMRGTGLTPLTAARDQVVPVNPATAIAPFQSKARVDFNTTAMPGMNLTIPTGYSGVELYNLRGQMVWSHQVTTESAVKVPSSLEMGILQAKFTR